MLSSGLPRVLLRRWYVTLFGLFITIGLGLFAISAFPATHQAVSYVLVTPPKSTDGSGGNPLLALGGMEASADVLSRAMTDSATADALRTEGVVDDYTVARDLTTDGPVIIVTTVDGSGSRALTANREVVARMAPTLQRLQDSLLVPTSAQVATTTINAASKTTTIRKTQERSTVLALAIGLLFTVLTAALLDRLLVSRRRRAPRSEPAQEDAPDEELPLSGEAPRVGGERAPGEERRSRERSLTRAAGASRDRHG